MEPYQSRSGSETLIDTHPSLAKTTPGGKEAEATGRGEPTPGESESLREAAEGRDQTTEKDSSPASHRFHHSGECQSRSRSSSSRC